MADKIYRDLIFNPDETLVKVIRKPVIVLIAAIIVPICLIAADFFFLYRLMFYFGNQGLVIFCSVILLSLIWIFRSFVVWYYQIFIITTQRLFDIDRRGLFRKSVSTVPFSKIQDVYYQVEGIWQTIFRVGTIYIYIIDSKTRLEISSVARPQRLQQLILQLKSDTLNDKLDSTNLSAAELIALVKKIKTGIGEKKFREIISQAAVEQDDEEAETEEDDEAEEDDVDEEDVEDKQEAD